MKKEKKNYIDNIPQINNIEWEVKKGGIVELKIENKGFYNTIAQKFFKKPRHSFIKLDEYGSCVWRQIDGIKSIYEIGKLLKETHKGAANQLYERLATFFKILERHKYIVFVNDNKK